MNTITDDYAAQRKAEAIAARRSALPPHLRQHLERREREQEARRVSVEYRQAQRDAERATQPHKECNQCGASLPLAAFEVLPSGSRRGTCKRCRMEAKNANKRVARAARRETPEYQAELERKRRERAAKQAEREEANAAALEAELAKQEEEREGELAAFIARRRKRVERQRGARQRPVSPEQQRENVEEVERLSAQLVGLDPHKRITGEGEWNETVNKLQKLWLQSGDKRCVSCKQTVLPSAMLPPGPANFYPGRCHRCAEAECYENSRRVTGRDPEGPRRIPMRDGTTITIAELARRHRERERGYRFKRFGKGQ